MKGKAVLSIYILAKVFINFDFNEQRVCADHGNYQMNGKLYCDANINNAR